MRNYKKDYRKIMSKMNRKQLNEQYTKARIRILSVKNSLEMIDALDQFEFSIMFLEKSEKVISEIKKKPERIREILTEDLVIKDFRKAKTHRLMLFQEDLIKWLKNNNGKIKTEVIIKNDIRSS